MKSILLPLIGSFVFLLLATIPFVHSVPSFDNTDSSGSLDESYVYDYYDLSNNYKENDKDKAAQVNIQSQLAHGSFETTTVVTTKAKSTNYDDYYDYDDNYDVDNYNYESHNNVYQDNIIEGHQFIDPKPKVENNKETNAFEPSYTSTKTQTTKSARSKLLAIMAKPGILAGIVGGAIIGVLTAILLIMFIVYRMKKKDEGSYALEETKKPLNSYDYRHCPTKEFYA